MSRFPKSQRIRRRRDFLRIQDHGTKVSVDHLLALAQKGETSATRVGFTVSSKVGNSVVRNRVRRRLRELWRASQSKAPGGVDIVVIARPSSAKADFAQLSRSFGALVQKLARLFP